MVFVATSTRLFAQEQQDAARREFEANKAKAEAGDAVAQWKLGQAYHKGEGVTQNDAEAVRWIRKAAEQNQAQALRNLGSCYILGLGVPENEVEGLKWYRRAAEQNGPGAQYYIGVCYHEGQGVMKAGEPGRKVPIGVEINSVKDDTIPMIAEHANNGGQVFIDSGTFPRFQDLTAMKDGKPKDPRNYMGPEKIGTPEFRERYLRLVNFPKVLEKYRRIADATRVKKNLFMVGTDLIGDQEKSIELVQQYEKELGDLIDQGVNVLIAVKRGSLPPSEAFQKVIEKTS